MPGLTDFGLGGGIIGSSLIGAGSQKETNELMMNMSNTQYQRAMADMEAAGLNPILAADKGGAGTPQLQAPGKELGGAVANAIQFGSIDKPIADAEVGLKAAAESNTKQQEKKAKEETALTKMNQLVAGANAKQMNELARRTGAEADQEELKGRMARAAGGKMDELAGKEGKAWSDAFRPDKQREALKKQRQNRMYSSHKTPSQAYEGGRGNVYGGSHSAKSKSNSIFEHNPVTRGGTK